jgi:hypothetical protein
MIRELLIHICDLISVDPLIVLNTYEYEYRIFHGYPRIYNADIPYLQAQYSRMDYDCQIVNPPEAFSYIGAAVHAKPTAQ